MRYRLFFLFIILSLVSMAQHIQTFSPSNPKQGDELTLYLSTSFLFSVGNPPFFCGSFVSSSDTIGQQELIYDITIDISGIRSPGSACTRFDTIISTNKFQSTGVHEVIVFWSALDTTGGSNNFYSRYDSDTLQLLVQSGVTSILENFKSNFSLYPNPVGDKLNIDGFMSLAIERIEVRDVKGRLVKAYTKTNRQLNVESLSSGIYLLNIIGKDGSWRQKFVKQ